MKIFFYALMLVGLLYACRETINKPSVVENTPATIQSATPAVQNINVDDAKKLIASNPNLVILDVRTPEETAEGIISGAAEIDFEGDNFKTEVAKLSKDATYLVYCRTGNRSGQAGEFMIRNGFNDVYNMIGGYTDWK